MTVTRDLAYYGGNANNKRYLEGLVAQNAPATPAPASNLQSELAIAETLLSALKADSAALTPPAPESVPTWKAKA